MIMTTMLMKRRKAGAPTISLRVPRKNVLKSSRRPSNTGSHRSGGSNRRESHSSSSRRDRDRDRDRERDGPRSPGGSSLKSDRSHRSSSQRNSAPPESPYKSMSSKFMDESTASGSISSTPRRSKQSHTSGIPRSPAGIMMSPGGSSRKSSNGSVTSSGSSNRRRASPKDRGSASRRASTGTSTTNSTGESSPDKLARILELGDKWKTMKQKHEMAAQQATSRRVDLTKEIF